jgi:4'-phosphopantetheinyl transferase
MKTNEIHLWNGCIAAGKDSFLGLCASLSREELEKADGFRFDKDRRSYIICRGLLRSILGTYLQVKPAEIQFQYGREGKPFLQDRAIHFSVSHSEDRVLYALCRNHELGVDLEYVRELPDVETLARHSFAPSEYAAFCNTVPAVRTRAFFCCWTRKEAYMKATGRGLSLPPDSFEVPSEYELLAEARIMLGPDAKPSNWSLRHLDPAHSYVGALATPLVSAPLLEWTFESAEECGERIDRLFSESHRDSRLPFRNRTHCLESRTNSNYGRCSA